MCERGERPGGMSFLKAPAKKKRQGMGFAFGGNGTKKPRPVFGKDEESKRPPPSALMAFGAEEDVKRLSPSAMMAGGADVGAASDEAVDPLDAFMAVTVAEAEKPSLGMHKPEEYAEDADEDFMDDYTHKDSGVRGGGDNSDDEVYAAEKKIDKAIKAAEAKGDDDEAKAEKKSGVLPEINHEEMVYMPIKKEFYTEDKVLAALSDGEVASYKKSLELSVTWITGGVAPRPLQSFAQAGFGPEIMVSIAKAGYEKPTGIQAQAWPILLRGY